MLLRHRVRPARGRLARITRISLLGALLALGLVVPILPGTGTPAQASPTDRRLASWNMNGQFQRMDDRTRESRWSNSIVSRWDNTDVLALQEAGNEPPGVRTQRRFSQSTVHEYIWQAGSSDRTPDRTTANIYWADVGQQRNGLAFVTRETAVDVVSLEVAPGSRPILGVQLGNDWYFTGHARSLGNQPNDQVQMYNRARDFMNNHAPNADWLFMADFNNEPGSIPIPLQRHVIMAGQPTHQGGRELDYWLLGDRNNGTLSLDRPGGAETADHFFLRLVHENCRRDGADCNAPMPGRTYRFESAEETGKALAIGDVPQLVPFDEKTAADDPRLRVTVRYSNAPGTYMLSVLGDKCLVTRQSGDAWYTDTAQCDPNDPAHQWGLTGDRIQSVLAGSAGQGSHMQPGVSMIGNGLNGNMALGDKPSSWRPVEVDEPALDDTTGNSPVERGDDDSPGGGNPKPGGDDGRGDPGTGQAG
ncbi:endonuclease/exonuclease/phosphatase family protein [Streptomyces sp. NPDC048636]|uniref:endonuclease/exonuclease/phosphatase family protein n=1 Tax=Streptomyces sp. NPDC048636 TaxID=3155762 RepID=UPI003449F0A2